MRYVIGIPPLLALLAGAVQAQVTPAPRRVSPDFQGQLPFQWIVEGSGTLRGLRLGLLNEQGREVWFRQDFELRDLGGGRWQAWSLEAPKELFKGLSAGRYTLASRMAWDQGGQLRTEETEGAFLLEGRGEGWLQKAYLGGEAGPVAWKLGTQWPRAGSYALQGRGAQNLRKLRYQLVSEADEAVLRPWTELPLQPSTSTWNLRGDERWPDGPALLWILQEGSQGQAWVESREIWLGRSPVQGGPRAADLPKKPVGVGSARSLGTAAAVADAPTVANVEWMRQIEDSVTPLTWDQSNRVATVGISYWDAERNEGNLFPTGSQAQWRPMSLSLTGANGLGKPLYGVNYLLASGTSLDTVVEQATRDAFVLPQGAATLQVGGALAPVVMSPGTVEDFLGKPLAAGYGWAATLGDPAGQPGGGATASAWAWSQQATPGAPLGKATAPPVGVDAIESAARFRANLQAQIKADLYGTDIANASAELDLDGTRDPYALSFASQDPLGRTVLAKGLGSRLPEQLDATLPLIKTPQPPVVSRLADSFDQELGGWYLLGPGASHVFDPVATTNGYIQLQPPYSINLSSWIPLYLTGYPAGTFTVNLGSMLPGQSSIAVDFKYQGPMKLELLDGIGTVVWTQSYTSSTLIDLPTLRIGGASGVWSPTVPSTLRLLITNPSTSQTVTWPDNPLSPAFFLNLDELNVTSTQTYQGLKSPEGALDDGAHPALPGYNRTQFGTVEGTGSLLDGYVVSMVTDADGAAIAEVKDHEGRTTLKVVNPDATYTDHFLEYRLNPDGSRKAFRPSASRIRGLAGGVSSGPQTNLATQYVFDAEGHLRAVIPPKGLSGKTWGRALKDSDLEGVLSSQTTDFAGVAARAQALAPYGTFSAYDYAGHLVASYHPDEGLTRFLVDQKGRVHYSQTEKQRAASTWTRTLYDGVYRVLAVGELATGIAPAADLEGLPTFDPASAAFSTALGSLKAASLSKNVYDDYAGLDPTSATSAPGLDPQVQALLPKPALWGAFADGHLTQTSDVGTVERYYYDQDGHVVIRWVSLSPSGGPARQFAIGIYYDFVGRVKRLVYPSGPGGAPLQVVYAYDDLGRLYAVGTPTDGAYFARYAYYPTGELRAVVYGPGKGFAAKQMLQDPQGWLRSLKVKGR